MAEWMRQIEHEPTRRALLHLVDKVYPQLDREVCHRCGHTDLVHTLNDSENVAPTDSAAMFRCVQGHHEVGVRLCDCPNFTGGSDCE